MVPTNPVILIVEDDADTRDLLGRVLSAAGYSVRFAANGWEALLALANPAPDLVLLDMMLPGLDGVAFLQCLRSEKCAADVPVVVVTAMERVEVEALVQPYRVEAILTKSGRFGDLKAVLMRTLAKPRPHARVNLPEPGSLVRPYLDVYLKMLAWS